MTLREKLLKQHLREHKQIMPPHRPGMPTRIFTVLVLHPQLIKLGHHDFTIVEGNVCLAAHRNPQVFEVGIDGGRVVFHELILRPGKGGIVGKPARTEYPQVCEQVGVFDARIQSLQATHGQTSQGPVFGVRFGAEIALHKRNCPQLQLIFKSPQHIFVESSQAASAAHVAIEHDDDHGFGFAFGNQVVQDEVGAALGSPAPLVFTAAVQEVEHRIFGARLVVSRRGIDVHFTPAIGRFGEVALDADVAVRHVF